MGLRLERSQRSLSNRELEVLKLVAEGYGNKEIAKKLGLSFYTVKSHLARMSKVMGTGDRAGMVGRAFRKGIIT